MKSLDLSHYALSCAALVSLAGCAALRQAQGDMPPIGAPGAMQQRHAGTGYQMLYSFGAGYDGRTPKSGLIISHRQFYGTTYSGGAHGMGTVFKISTTGQERVLYSFQAAGDGTNPSAGLVGIRGTLYGTTEYGGAPGNDGTVFEVDSVGTEKVLYSFHGYSDGGDGANPVASLVGVNGTLYGTTEHGGGSPCDGNGCGTVFSISPSGVESVLHAFLDGSSSDGALPVAGLVYAHGTLWGTTEYGGYIRTRNQGNGGTVFRVTATGSEKTVYMFGGYTDASVGSYPQAGLANVNGTLYGSTSSEGKYGGGTVLGYHHPTRPKLLHSFGSGSDGSSPVAALLNVKGTLYGTTSAGGTYGGGTAFSINSVTGAEMVLHSFGSGSDGATPLAGLIDVKGTLYGTTSAGGTYGYGTVYALSP